MHIFKYKYWFLWTTSFKYFCRKQVQGVLLVFPCNGFGNTIYCLRRFHWTETRSSILRIFKVFHDNDATQVWKSERYHSWDIIRYFPRNRPCDAFWPNLCNRTFFVDINVFMIMRILGTRINRSPIITEATLRDTDTWEYGNSSV